MFGDHGRRRVGNEIFVRQFLAHSRELRFHLRDLLFETFFFGVEINQPFQRQAKSAKRGERSRCSFCRFVVLLDVQRFRVKQNFQHLRFV